MKKTHEGPIMVRGKGIGFVAHPDLTEDIVIERESLGFALDGDIVEVELKPKAADKRQEGVVIRVVKPAHRELIGTVKERTENGQMMKYVQPDNTRIHIRPLLPTATSNDMGMKVVVEIESWKNPLPCNTLGGDCHHRRRRDRVLRSVHREGIQTD